MQNVAKVAGEKPAQTERQAKRTQDPLMQLIYRASQHDTGVDVLQGMRTVPLPCEFKTIQQALLEVRVVIEDVNAVARSEKTYGRGDVAAELIKLAVTAASMASAMRARDTYEVIKSIDSQPSTLSMTNDTPVKAKKRRAAQTACAA